MSVSHLIELDAQSWLDWIDLPANGPVESIESDVATVLAEVDKVLRIDAASPWLAHIELQASHDPRLSSRLLQYHALLHHRHQLPVESTVVLLRRQADGPELTGRFEQHGRSGFVSISFGYHVVRLWERSVTELLGGGLGLLPLAPLAAVEPGQVPALVRRIDERFTSEADPTTADELRSATLFLLGMRYDDRQIRSLVQEMSWLRESSTYRVAVEEGRAVGLSQGQLAATRQILLDLGREKFGSAGEAVVTTVQRIDDLGILQRLTRGILTAASWDDLLAALPDR